MAEDARRGTTRLLSSVFPAEEAQKAAKRVQESIAEREKEVDRLQQFISDNNSLLKLVEKLPDQLSHDIMVPFGKAAFFPGRLIHTNEFMVLLGEGYYAEQTSKQTLEIFHRRGKVLDSKLESLKATMVDLQAEASFFNNTAAEAAEGLVEIREDYVEEQPTERKSESGLPESNSSEFSEADKMQLTAEDEEYARIMSRLDELEKQEQEAYMDDEDGDDESGFEFSDDPLKDPVENLMDESSFSTTTAKTSGELVSRTSLPKKSMGKKSVSFQFDDLKTHLVAKGENSLGKDFSENITVKPNTSEKPLLLSRSKDPTDSAPKLDKTHATVASEAVCAVHHKIQKSDDAVDHTSKMSSRSQRKAFTGSIVEHSYGLPSNPTSAAPSSSQVSNNSKPVSRFRAQRRW